QHAVGVAEVVGAMIGVAEVHGGVDDLAGRDDLRRARRLVAEFTAPTEPQAAAAPQRIAHGDGQTAGRAAALARQRDAIGDDYQPRQNAASQLLLSRMADAIRPTREWGCGKSPPHAP